MKFFKYLIFAFLSVVSVSATAADFQTESYHRDHDIYGYWRMAYPLNHDPYVLATGAFHLDDRAIWFEVTCSFYGGPTLKAEAHSPIRMGRGSFTILRNDFDDRRWGTYGCRAGLAEGHVEYHYDRHADRLTLFSPYSGWRVVLIR